MADITQKLKLLIEQEGEQAVSSSLKKLQGEVDKTAKSQGGLTKFIREQRIEQRQHSFLFRESAGVMLLVNNVMGETSKSAKELKNSINAGFSTFQAFNFLLAGLPPGLSLAVSAVGGLVAAIAAQDTAMSASIQVNKELQSQIRLTTEERLKGIRVIKTEAEIELAKIQSSKAFLYSKGMRKGRGDMGMSDQEIGLVATVGLAGRLLNQISEDAEKGKGHVIEMLKPMELLFTDPEFQKSIEKAVELFDKISQGAVTTTMRQQLPQMKTVSQGELIRLNPDDELKKAMDDLSLVNDMVGALGDTLRGSLGGAFEDVFGEANSLLEQFAQKLFEILAMRAFGSLLNLIPGVGPILAAGFGTFSSAGGGSPVSGGGQLDRQLANPTFQRAFNRAQSNRVRLGKAA